METDQAHIVTTEKAQDEIRRYMTAEDVDPSIGGVRVAVKPGGCSGFKYDISVVDKPEEDDFVEEAGGVRVFVDPFSAQYLEGVELDYVSSINGSGFSFKNPKATGGCGCGSSFTA